MLNRKALLFSASLCLAISTAVTTPSDAMEVEYKDVKVRFGGGRPRFDDSIPEPDPRIEKRNDKYGWVPPDFNQDLYLSLHNDLKKNKKKCNKRHEKYHNFGAWHFSTKRKTRNYLPTDFDPERYINLHSDLRRQATSITNPAERKLFARTHYAHEGWPNKRRYK